MDVQRIEYFLKVAEALNFSKAAAQLHISRQALSKQISLLEGELGAKLLERSTTHVALTEVGVKVQEVFRPLIQELEYGYEEIQDFIHEKNTFLSVGYFNGLSYSRVIAPAIRWLEESAPQIHVNMLATDVGMVRQLLDQDSIDLAIFPAFSSKTWKNTVCIPIYQSPLYIVVSERHPWYTKEEITTDDLEKGSLLIYANRPTVGEQALLPDLKVENRISVYNFDTYMGLLRRGEAFGLMGDTYSRREGNYKRFPLPGDGDHQALIMAAFKRLHPLRHVMRSLEELSLKPSVELQSEWEK